MKHSMEIFVKLVKYFRTVGATSEFSGFLHLSLKITISW